MSQFFLHFLWAESSVFFQQPEERLCAAAGCLLHLQDGGVALHDGHNDFVDVVLEPVVDLFLFVHSLHQLQTQRHISVETQRLKVEVKLSRSA